MENKGRGAEEHAANQTAASEHEGTRRANDDAGEIRLAMSET